MTTDLAFQLGLKVEQGAYVVDTPGGAPAEAAGIQAGDVIVAIDGHDVTSGEDVGTILEGLEPGQSVPVEIVGTDGTPPDRRRDARDPSRARPASLIVPGSFPGSATHAP